MKRNNVCIIGIPEREEKAIGSIFKAIRDENFLNLGIKMNVQNHEAQRTPNRLNPNWAVSRHIIITLSKVKDKNRILRAVREKREGTYKETP